MRAFLNEVFGFVCFGIVLSLLQVNASNQYKNITANMVNEYHLTSTAYSLISQYNEYAIDPSTTSTTSDRSAITASEKQINRLYGVLDKTVLDTNSLSSYIGLKNTINSLVTEINTGVYQYSHGLYVAQSTYNQANQLYGFVATDSGTFINASLAHISTVQKQVDKTYRESVVVGAIAFIFVVSITIVFARRFSGIVINPIDRLTTTAERISGGDLDSVIEKDLLDHEDETGRLANAFNVMFSSLKDKIGELREEKESIEKKVTERTAELNNERVRLEASINALDVGFIMTDPSNNIFLINNAAAAIFSYSLNGSPQDTPNISDWTTELIQDRLVKNIDFKASLEKVMSTGKTIQQKALDYNGKILSLQMAPVVDYGSPGTDSRRLGVVVLLEDVTEEKIMERSKDEFFSIASHELRTPLTSIKGNASMIMDFYKEVLKDPQLKEMVQDIHTSSVRLIEIVNDFLDISRLEQGKMSFAYMPVSLEKVIEEVVYEMKVVLNEKNIYLKADKMTLNSLPKVWVDENRLKQVVYNLVGNASKFTDNGGISITTDANTDQNFIKVMVSDTGRGMTSESQQLLFHKFQQASSSLLTRDTTRGTGLGLYISKMIIENMGGKIALESSEVDKGSVFSFTVPVATTEQLASTESTVETIDSTTGLSIAAKKSVDTKIKKFIKAAN